MNKELSEFSLNLIQYLTNNTDNILEVPDKTYKKRTVVCNLCEHFDDKKNVCKKCGCYLPPKAKVVFESCPVKKWDVDKESWNDKFEKILKDLGHSQ